MNKPANIQFIPAVMSFASKLLHENNLLLIYLHVMPQMVQENKKLKRQSQLLISQVGGQVNLVCVFFLYFLVYSIKSVSALKLQTLTVNTLFLAPFIHLLA